MYVSNQNHVIKYRIIELIQQFALVLQAHTNKIIFIAFTTVRIYFILQTKIFSELSLHLMIILLQKNFSSLYINSILVTMNTMDLSNKNAYDWNVRSGISCQHHAIYCFRQHDQSYSLCFLYKVGDVDRKKKLLSGFSPDHTILWSFCKFVVVNIESSERDHYISF